MEIRLAEELFEVCRDYCNATWDKALSAAGVPVDSVLRQSGSIYYHPHIREVPNAIPPSTAIAPTLLSSPWPSKLLSLPQRFQKGLARLVIKIRELREIKTRIRARGNCLSKKPRVLLRTLQLRQRKRRPRLKNLILRPRMLLPPS